VRGGFYFKKRWRGRIGNRVMSVHGADSAPAGSVKGSMEMR
jgi:hypothetical protein